MNQPSAYGVLIADTRRESFPLIPAQWAQLRGIKCSRLDLAEGGLPAHGWGAGGLLMLSYRTLSALGTQELRTVKAAVSRGATLYIRGGFPAATTCSLAPFAAGIFLIDSRRAQRYRLTGHPLLPRVLNNEEAAVDLNAGGALLAGSAQALAVACDSGPEEAALVFTLQCGAGIVIYDLLPDEVAGGASTPIVSRLAGPASRCFEVGALAAINHITARRSSMVGAYNLVLDDRPRDLDFFNVTRVTRWLSHINDVCPGTHVDFAWTPEFTHPSSRYIDALKRFKVGFVWHGLYRHIDHGQVDDPAAHYGKGLKLVQTVVRRYGARFQPIMVFPFERANPTVLHYLPTAGFTGAVFSAHAKPGWANPLPEFMRNSTPLHELYGDYVPAPRRYQAYELTRDFMLANAALDLPIIAAAHPFEIGLRRYAALYNPFEPVSSHFDDVLKFAREKQLRPMSLEDIVVEMIDRSGPTREMTALGARPRRRDVTV